MQKRLVNQCLIDLEIHAEGPLLVKAGLTGLDGPDMAPVVTFRSRTRPEPYIPGSSLKGILRSHAERIARTLCWEPESWRIGACDPFLANKQDKDWAKPEGSCGAKFQERKDRAKAKKEGEEAENLSPPIVYRDSCPACKVFGSTFFIGRLAAPDAYLLPDSSYRREQRDGVGIDRHTGGAANRAKFELEVITNATFAVQLKLVNFELWQLGWLAYVLRDLSDGQIGIGSGKSRGLGQSSASIPHLELSTVARHLPQSDSPRLWGLSALEPETARHAYGYHPEAGDGVPLEGADTLDDPLGLRKTYRLEGMEKVTALWQQVAPLATQYLEDDYEIPQAMRLEVEQQQR
jgi:CRISPR-associated RAMP protein (TIGR02581 family)